MNNFCVIGCVLLVEHIMFFILKVNFFLFLLHKIYYNFYLIIKFLKIKLYLYKLDIKTQIRKIEKTEENNDYKL